MGTELTTEERHCLTAYEAVIAQGMESFIDVGNALCQIRDGDINGTRAYAAQLAWFEAEDDFRELLDAMLAE